MLWWPSVDEGEGGCRKRCIAEGGAMKSKKRIAGELNVQREKEIAGGQMSKEKKEIAAGPKAHTKKKKEIRKIHWWTRGPGKKGPEVKLERRMPRKAQNVFGF
ncbi:uncharacterized protein Bfra_002286 [Botrytis fragariae]|uniref:Uncharacterized protein n=1 Tax=Botrytis fragariae TaxID=1964551 RepID=A0A8H6AYR0_9HELO|nr:uncharacterized protein Bfra_002286 [Botrytis fragariae]KAF5875890.1 hypothetical protein Bfra_002286 [Botrytis fragariae]